MWLNSYKIIQILTLKYNLAKNHLIGGGVGNLPRSRRQSGSLLPRLWRISAQWLAQTTIYIVPWGW